jgi:hypothetical protein
MGGVVDGGAVEGAIVDRGAVDGAIVDGGCIDIGSGPSYTSTWPALLMPLPSPRHAPMASRLPSVERETETKSKHGD